MEFRSVEKEYCESRIPYAFRRAVMKSKEAEMLIYQVLTSSLENCDDVIIYLDKTDSVCSFLRSWKKQGHLTENALRYEEFDDETSAYLLCNFDIYAIREDLEFVNDTFGTIDMREFEKSLESKNIDILDQRQTEFSKGIQKVKRVREVKKDN